MKPMKYKGYIAEVGIDQENGILYGNVFGARDVISFRGKTPKELINNFHDSINDYLEYCEENNLTPEKPYSGNFNVRIAPSLHKALAEESFKSRNSMNDIVQSAIETFVLRQEAKDHARKTVSSKKTSSTRKKRRSTASRKEAMTS